MKFMIFSFNKLNRFNNKKARDRFINYKICFNTILEFEIVLEIYTVSISHTFLFSFNICVYKLYLGFNLNISNF
jgi:hypothetical protein